MPAAEPIRIPRLDRFALARAQGEGTSEEFTTKRIDLASQIAAFQGLKVQISMAAVELGGWL